LAGVLNCGYIKLWIQKGDKERKAPCQSFSEDVFFKQRCEHDAVPLPLPFMSKDNALEGCFCWSSGIVELGLGVVSNHLIW